MFNFKCLVVKYLRDIANKIEGGTSEVTEEEAIGILKIIAHRPLSKEQACKFMNLSRSRFDDLVREGKLPKGRKRVGLKELAWWEDELELYKNK